MINLMLGDCLERMKEIPTGSVDLILCDLPYGTMDTDGGRKMGVDGWDIVIDTRSVMTESDRILRKNGKMCLFAQDPFSTELKNESIPNLPYNYSAIWEKDNFANPLSAKKAMVNYYEDILIFSKNHQKHDFKGEHPLRLYFKHVMEFIGLNLKQINNKLGHRRAEHTFYVNSTQYGLCTEKTYNELIEVFKINLIKSFVDFSTLKDIDQKYRQDLLERMNKEFPSVFNLWEGEKFKSNILKYKKDYNGLHPTQKPVLLLEDLIKTFSNEGDLVVDMTMGSGSTGVATKNLNRKFIGIEMDENYFNIAQERIANAN
jgi:site-specific DNA-methyltransferase (adenine-specific)